MNKKEVKRILMSIRTTENIDGVNYLLGKIDLQDESEIQEIATRLGNDEENIRRFLLERISKKTHRQDDEKYSINEMFTYGISSDCVHLHLPVQLAEYMSKYGPSKTMAMVNLHLLDAIEKINTLKEDGFHRFQDK